MNQLAALVRAFAQLLTPSSAAGSSLTYAERRAPSHTGARCHAAPSVIGVHRPSLSKPRWRPDNASVLTTGPSSVRATAGHRSSSWGRRAADGALGRSVPDDLFDQESLSGHGANRDQTDHRAVAPWSSRPRPMPRSLIAYDHWPHRNSSSSVRDGGSRYGSPSAPLLVRRAMKAQAAEASVTW